MNRPILTSLITLTLLAGSATANETGLGGAPDWTHTGPGTDFAQASDTTRASLPFGGQSNPFPLVLPSLPAGASVVRSFAVWHYHHDGVAPATDIIKINGANVLGTFLGGGTDDLGHGKDRTSVYVAESDGGSLVLGGANSILDATDKPLGSDPLALGAGMSLLVVYELPGQPLRQVSLWRGYSSTETSTSGNAEADLDLASPYLGGSAHTFLSVLDGERGPRDEFQINGTSVGGQVSGTVDTDDAWQGLLGPGPFSNLYDVLNADVSAGMTPGDVELRMRSVPLPSVGSEEIGFSMAALATDVECGTWAGYCTPQVNSLGCPPVIGAVGKASAGASGQPFGIVATNLRNNSVGLLIYGFAEGAGTLGNGTLCISGVVRRTPGQFSGGSAVGDDCTGSLNFNWNAWAATAGDPLVVPGAQVYVQYWSRDVGDAFGSNLSAGLTFDLCD